MAASPKFKVFNIDGDYIASFKYLQDAAQFISLEDGREVRLGHSRKNRIWCNTLDWFGRMPTGTWALGARVRQEYDIVTERALYLYPDLEV